MVTGKTRARWFRSVAVVGAHGVKVAAFVDRAKWVNGVEKGRIYEIPAPSQWSSNLMGGRALQVPPEIQEQLENPASRSTSDQQQFNEPKLSPKEESAEE